MYKQLFRNKSFSSIFWVQCMGAINDSVFKNALLVLLSIKITNSEELIWQANLSTGLFMLPYIIFSGLAGQLADRYNKAKLVQTLKIIEIPIVIMALCGFYTYNVNLLMFSLFMMGTQSTFYGPLKYSMLPEYLNSKELLAGNALVESSTFIIILLGTLTGAALISSDYMNILITVILLTAAILGWAISLFTMPKHGEKNNSVKVQINPITSTYSVFKKCYRQRKMILIILGISWFWMMGTFIITQLPTVNNLIHGSTNIVTFMLASFTIGTGIGSLLSNRLLQQQIDSRFSPFCLLAMSIALFDMSHAIDKLVLLNLPHGITVADFMQLSGAWRLNLDIIIFSILGGIFIVPLYTILQHETRQHLRSRMIACNNIVNSIFIIVGAIITMILAKMSYDLIDIIKIFVLLNTITACCLFKILSFETVQVILRTLMKIFYRVEIKGIENCLNAGKRVIVIANHVSLLDVPLLGACLPGKYMFAVNTQIAKRWWVKLPSILTKTYTIDPSSAIKTKSLIQEVADGNRCIIFPEGRLTTTGSLMKIYDGVALIAENANAVILPIYIDGPQYSPFSYITDKVKVRWFPKVTLTISPARKITAPSDLKGKKRREYLSQTVYDTMSNMVFEGREFHQNLFISLLESCKFFGYRHVICEDINRKPANYYTLITKSLILRKCLKPIIAKQQNIGVFLPNSIGLIATIFSLFALGKTPALLNYASGLPNIISCCRTGKITTIISSRKFVEVGKFDGVIAALSNLKIKIIFLEDIAEKISIKQKISTAAWPLCNAKFLYNKIPNRLHDPAVMLFTSGSEGLPKAVMLSHKNIQTAVNQMISSIDLNIQDIAFNPLPIFHSFGLSCGTLMPIFNGIKVFTYPSPLHYRIIPEIIYDTNATVLVGTSTFLTGYQKFAHPYDFCNLRYVFAGAEKVNPQTRQFWFEQFGCRILEGYGATEASPVISINTPMHHKTNTAGRLLPGMEYKLTPHGGVTDGGRLWVKGGNIMLGYMLPENPGMLCPPPGGWHDTGDIVTVDDSKFITIIDRAKRFAKIAGEMVSLSAVENMLNFIWPTTSQVVVSIACDRKGEKIVCVTNNKKADKKDIIQYCQSHHVSELTIPGEIIIVDEVPTLATGKTNYVEILQKVKDGCYLTD